MVKPSKGRTYREIDGKYVSLYKWIDGRIIPRDKLTTARIEAVGRTMAELHSLSKSYKKGIENRFSFDRVLRSRAAASA